MPSSAWPDPPTSEAFEHERSEALTFVEIEVVDEHARPVANAAYELELPNGRALHGRLDARGFVRTDDIPEGACRVVCPDLATAVAGES